MNTHSHEILHKNINIFLIPINIKSNSLDKKKTHYDSTKNLQKCFPLSKFRSAKHVFTKLQLKQSFCHDQKQKINCHQIQV